jgi:hypothetical protein
MLNSHNLINLVYKIIHKTITTIITPPIAGNKINKKNNLNLESKEDNSLVEPLINDDPPISPLPSLSPSSL